MSEKARARLIREGSEQRIEALEDTIDMMSETIKSLQEKVSMISICSAGLYKCILSSHSAPGLGYGGI